MSYKSKAMKNGRDENKSLYNLFLLLVFTILLFSISFLKMEGSKFTIELGDTAAEDIRASTEIYDEETTEKLKKEARDGVPERYRISPSVQMNMKNSVEELFLRARDIVVEQESIKENSDSNLEPMTEEEMIEELNESLNFYLSTEDKKQIINMDPNRILYLKNTLEDLIVQVMGVGIKEEDLSYEMRNLGETFETLNLSDDEKELGLTIMKEIIEPNKFLDEEETEKNKLEAEEAIEPVIIKENEIIVSKGERVDRHNLDLIKKSGLLKDEDGFGIKTALGTILLIFCSILFIYTYLFAFNEEVLSDGRFPAILIIIFLVILISGLMNSISPYLIPASTAALLIAVLIEPQVGIMANMIISIYLGFLLRLDISIIFMLIVGGSLGIVFMEEQKDRSNLLINGVLIGIANVIVITSFGLLKSLSIRTLILRNIQAFINGIISVIMAIGSLPLWENLFNILTPVRLVELSNPNQPLIKKMLIEAPGTYHHSLMVGNLAEAGAEAIGADALLARAGAYYHDIGKMKRPYYFKENQFGMDNPHDKLSAEESARIILSHTVDGEEMAKEAKLPEEVVAFTTEHHGNTAVAYFYYEAKKENPDVTMDDFRYKGKKPQSKETAIVMMADSVEAAVRSIESPTTEKIEEMIRKVIQGKLDDGQFDECNITNRDIYLIIPTFTKVLTGIYHDRISYPELDEGE